jgi:hypothetical protein
MEGFWRVKVAWLNDFGGLEGFVCNFANQKNRFLVRDFTEKPSNPPNPPKWIEDDHP